MGVVVDVVLPDILEPSTSLAMPITGAHAIRRPVEISRSCLCGATLIVVAKHIQDVFIDRIPKLSSLFFGGLPRLALPGGGSLCCA